MNHLAARDIGIPIRESVAVALRVVISVGKAPRHGLSLAGVRKRSRHAHLARCE